MIAICDTCKQDKEVCCQYLGKLAGYTYCRECCPRKLEHLKTREIKEETEPTLEERIEKLEAEIEDIKYRYQLRTDIDE